MTGRRTERGVTLLEVTITSALVVVVVGAVLGVFDGFVRAESYLDRRSRNALAQQQALAEFARDVRAVRQLERPVDPGQLATDLTVVVAGTTGTRRIRWQVDGEGRLLRRVLDSGEDARVVLDGLDASSSRFEYLSAIGTQLEPGTVPISRVLSCTRTVRLVLSRPEHTPAPQSISVSPRTLPTGGDCW